MSDARASFISGANRRLPTMEGCTGPAERIMRLVFHLHDEPVVIPTVVTRDWGAAGASTRIPQQAFMAVRMANISRLCPSRRPADSLATTTATQSQLGSTAVPSPSPHVDIAGVSLPGFAPGYKDTNQDAALLVDTFLNNRQQLLAVFDGHGPEGHRVSSFAQRNLPYTLLTQLMEEGEALSSESSPAGRRADVVMAVRMPSSLFRAPTPLGGGGAENGGGGPLSRALWRTVTSLDCQLEGSGIDVVNSGSTAVMCHVHGRRLTAAWVGDSRLLLGVPVRGSALPPSAIGEESGSRTPNVVVADLAATSSTFTGRGSERHGPRALDTRRTTGSVGKDGDGESGGDRWHVAWSSTDHKPELPEEAKRIEAAGGRVSRSVGRQGPVGPHRVWFQDKPFPGLAMSRALGDLPGRQIGITCTPSCASMRLPDRGPAVLVLASDGVWELLSNEQVLALAAEAGSAAEAASRIAQQSRRAWVKEYGGSYVDDITAVVMRFDMPPQERSSI